MFKAKVDGGGAVADGTQVFLTTDLGVIEERVATTIGIARATLRSNGRAGTATIRATSGTLEEKTATVEVGAGGEGDVITVVANPSVLGPQEFTSEIVATVTDSRGNPVADVPLIFGTDAGAMASAGAVLQTSSSGQAVDRLTFLDDGTDSATVTVTSGALTGTVTVSRATFDPPLIGSISPTSGSPGDTLDVTIDGLNFQFEALVNFGEGISVNSVEFVNSTRLVANITIDSNIQNTSSSRTVTVTNPDGKFGTLPSAFSITTPSPAPLITSLSPTQTSVRGATVTVFINGLNFQAGAQVTFSSSAGSVNILSTFFTSSTQMEVDITIDSVPIGPPAGTVFLVRVINPDGLQSNVANFTAN